VAPRIRKAISRRRPRPVRATRHWRWGRAERKNKARLAGYRTPVQVCPRGCEFRELARRDLLTKTRLWGKAVVHVAFTFETTNCPQCGAGMARRCGRCDEEILAPVVDRCQFCGLPQPWARERRAGADRADLRAWLPPDRSLGESKGHANDPAEEVYQSSSGGSLWVIEGDIAQLEVDAVVSNDDVDGRMWSQVARAIKSGAGEGVERIAQEGKPFRLGHAWSTTAGGLKQMKRIIHVASMNRRGKSNLRIVRKSLVAALRCAEEEGHRSLGIAPIGSGPTTIDPSRWYRMFGEVVVEHFSERKPPQGDDPHEFYIVLALFEPANYKAELQRVQAAVHRAWRRAGRPEDGTTLWSPPPLWRRLRNRLMPWAASPGGCAAAYTSGKRLVQRGLARLRSRNFRTR
jgi:O-acetyl-ADP-ribose deacetylase (regulator of RNase III)/predicted RNA-binding Zn-ribbon protein involved in translation (DUF1610 family)